LETIEVWEQRFCPVYLSANDHGAKIRPADYIAACDQIEDRLRPYGAPIIAPRHWADYRVLHQIVSNSGALACVAAWAMGCSPIVIVGCELYGGATYWHDPGAKSAGHTATVDVHLTRWAKLTAMTPGAMLRAVSGPLLRIFKGFEPTEPAEAPAQSDSIRALISGSRVEITKRVDGWHGQQLLAGQIIEMRASEAGLAIADGYGRKYRGEVACA
jgi:hypothetical protein